MGEADCLTQSFSGVSVATIDSERNPPRHLTESISFGRFATESLVWERWSTFSSNHYVEEAKKYSKPGSVAQKKAFFEAHYKTIASKKTVALLEQPITNANEQKSECVNHDLNPQDSLANEADEEPHVECPIIQSDLTTGPNWRHYNVAEDKLEETCAVSEVEKILELKKPPLKEHSSDPNHKVLPSMISTKPVYGTSQASAVSEVEKTLKLKKPPLKKHCSDWNLKGSSLVSSTKPLHGTSRVLRSHSKPAVCNHLKKENAANVIPMQGFNYSSESLKLKSPAKTRNHFYHRKEEINDPPSIKTTLDSWDKKRLTPKKLHALLNINEAPRSIGRSRISANDASKAASTHNSTLPRTPISVAIDGTPKRPLTTPKSETRRAKISLHALTKGSKTAPKCSSCEFSFLTKERAVKRKEKLEERLYALEAHRVQEQKKFKEKAECELRKLSQSLCFKARPLPDFYKRRAAKEDETKKEGLVKKHGESRKQERKANDRSRGNGVPPRKPETSMACSSSPSLTLTPPTENTSPNIQH